MNAFLRTPGLAAVAAAVALLFGASVAKANTINVVNGSFSQTSSAAPSELGLNSYSLTGWTNNNNGYNFVFNPATADTTGSASQYTNPQGKNSVVLYGPISASPDGGNFVAMNGVYQSGSISQMLSGLTIGAKTDVGFYYAGAQQKGYNGATTDAFQVTLGGQTINTAILNNVSNGFTGWKKADLIFTPTATSETLSFLALGTPSGEPPFALLDGVTVSDTVATTPEPGSLALLGTGVLGLAGMLRRRYTKI